MDIELDVFSCLHTVSRQILSHSMWKNLAIRVCMKQEYDPKLKVQALVYMEAWMHSLGDDLKIDRLIYKALWNYRWSVLHAYNGCCFYPTLQISIEGQQHKQWYSVTGEKDWKFILSLLGNQFKQN